MDKKAAAEELNCSVRRVEQLASEGRLGVVSYVRGRTGKQADFDAAAVAELKTELESVDTRLVAPQRVSSGLDAASGEGAAHVIALLESINERLAVTGAQLPSAPATPATVQPPPLADLAHKLTLSLVEATQLSGLSRGHLRAAIDEKKLKARIIGRGWRVKRSDLDSYVAKL